MQLQKKRNVLQLGQSHYTLHATKTKILLKSFKILTVRANF